jgi:hypothetical protein
MAQSKSTIMKRAEKKKNSCLFKSEEGMQDGTFAAVYLLNDAYDALGQPEEIIVEARLPDASAT